MQMIQGLQVTAILQFHHFSEERCLELMRRLAGALKAGGRLVIHDFISGARPAD